MLGLSGVALSVAKGVITIVVAAVTIIFITFFMILEGPEWVERFYRLLPNASQPRWRKVRHLRRLCRCSSTTTATGGTGHGEASSRSGS